MIDLKQVEVETETLASIDQGIKQATEGRTVPLEDVWAMIPRWISKFESQSKR